MNTIFTLNTPENPFCVSYLGDIQKKLKPMTDICYITGNK